MPYVGEIFGEKYGYVVIRVENCREVCGITRIVLISVINRKVKRNEEIVI